MEEFGPFDPQRYADSRRDRDGGARPFDPQRYADSRRDRDGGAPQVTRLDGRNGAIWRQYTIYRRTQEEIAEEFGISQTSVSQIIAEIRAGIPKHDLDAMRQESLELYRELTRRALEIVDLVPAPVYVGKDGAIAYDDQGKVVRDYSGRLRAIETAAKMEDHTRKLMGLDAATKQEVSGSVKYEMIGIDESDLT